MNSNLLLALVAVLGGTCLIWTALASRRQASERAVVSAVIISALVPTASPPALVTMASLTGSILILLVGTWRSQEWLRRTRPPVLLLIFILWSAVFGDIPGAGAERQVLMLTQAALLVALWIAVCALPDGATPLLRALPLLVLVQFALAFSEQFLGLPSVWPRVDGTFQEITRRNNTLAPWLPGRAMGTTSYAITLGILAALGTLAALMRWTANKRKLGYLLIAALGFFTIVLSGTRSALAALVLCCLFWFLTTNYGSRLIRAFFTAIATVLAVLIANPLQLLGLDRLDGTSSFEHRAGVLRTFPNLLTRDPQDVLFGSGYSSIGELLYSGVISGIEGINVFDQQFARTLAGTGLIGLLLLIAVLISGYRRANLFNRLTIVLLTITFFTYDTLSWRLLTVILIVAATPVRYRTPSRSNQGFSSSPPSGIRTPYRG